MLCGVRRVFVRGSCLLGLGVAAALMDQMACNSDPGSELCPSITASSEGLQVSDCPRGSITLSGATHDAAGTKTSYSFVVLCQGRSAHGVWSSAAGLQCAEGAFPCDGGVCTPTSNIDCEVLSNCVQLGECGYVDGKCVLTEDGCAKSEIPCGLAGLCHLGDGACVATSDADCQTPFGPCSDCAFKGACATSGNCHLKDGACVATMSSECKKSQQCAFAGKCSLDGEACIAATDADCAGSEVCRTAGQCSAVMGSCAVQ
jgi:hypothetical protein